MRHMTWSRFLDHLRRVAQQSGTLDVERIVVDNTTEGSTAVRWVAMQAGVDQATALKVLRAFFGR